MRRDESRPGKPHALGWAFEELPLENWDVCVILDADSVVDRQFASELVRDGHVEDRVQQTYFGTANEWESWLTRLAGVLTRVRYEIVYPLMNRPLHMPQIVLVCALQYAGHVLELELQEGHPRLTDWLNKIAERPSLAATAP